jgi:cytochrome c oxidase cbb3-type subunit 3
MLWRAAARVSGAMAISVLALVATPPVNAAGAAPPTTADARSEAAPAANLPATPASDDFPRPPSDPAATARGKQIFSVNCAFCHGSDARGGEGGPNLLRSPFVLNDQQGNLIATVVRTGRVEKGMPKFDLSLDSIADIAAYLHSIPLGRGGAGQPLDPKAILVGDAAAGRTYFFGQGHCARCHSLRGQFAHIGSMFDPKALQDNIVSAGATTLLGAPLPTAPPRTVTVTLASGEVFSGTLDSIDEFSLTVNSAAGRRTFLRDGDNPRLEIKNPLQAHLDMLRNWNDRDLHNLTAFLAGQK